MTDTRDPLSQPVTRSPEVETRAMTAADVADVSALHRRVFGPGRFARTAYRVREGASTPSPYCRIAVDGPRIVAALTMTPARIGDRGGGLLLGPLAVDPDYTNLGYGRRLIAESLAVAGGAGVQLVVLVGDMAYYGRLDFATIAPGRIVFPGPVDPKRLLYRELAAGAVAGYHGVIVADAAHPRSVDARQADAGVTPDDTDAPTGS